jgi:hypothetical protein
MIAYEPGYTHPSTAQKVVSASKKEGETMTFLPKLPASREVCE